MSLINDMLRDLEARKRAARQGGEERSAAGGEPPDTRSQRATEPGRAPPTPHPLLVRDASAHVGLDERVRRRGRWLIPLYALALIALAYSVYVTVAGPNGLLQRDSYSRAMREQTLPTTAAQDAAQSQPAATPSAAPAAKAPPRLVMIGIDEARGPALTLRLRFAPALTTPLRVNAGEGRVQLTTEDAEVGTLASPSPLLADWQSAQKDGQWHASFAWEGRVDVSLLPVLGDDASQGWVIRLLPAQEPAQPAQTTASVRATATSSVAPSAVPVTAAARPAQVSALRPSPSPSPRMAAPVAAATPAPAPAPAPAPVSAVASTVSRNAETLYADAWRMQQAGQLNDAIGRLEVLLEREPLHARGRELLARLWLRADRGDRAMQVLGDGLAASPGQPAWVELQARLLDNSGDRAEAIALLDHQGSPERLSHQALRGALNTQEGRFADAAKAYQLAVALDPRQPRWWLGLAVAWDNLGDRSAAHSAYQGALDTGQLDSGSERFARERLAALTDGAQP